MVVTWTTNINKAPGCCRATDQDMAVHGSNHHGLKWHTGYSHHAVPHHPHVSSSISLHIAQTILACLSLPSYHHTHVHLGDAHLWASGPLGLWESLCQAFCLALPFPSGDWRQDLSHKRTLCACSVSLGTDTITREEETSDGVYDRSSEKYIELGQTSWELRSKTGSNWV